jgi:hypothetical protein
VCSAKCLSYLLRTLLIDKDEFNKELHEFIYNELVDLSDSDDEDVDMMLMMSIQEEMENQVEHVPNFKGTWAGELFPMIGLLTDSVSTSTTSNPTQHTMPKFSALLSDEQTLFFVHS